MMPVGGGDDDHHHYPDQIQIGKILQRWPFFLVGTRGAFQQWSCSVEGVIMTSPWAHASPPQQLKIDSSHEFPPGYKASSGTDVPSKIGPLRMADYP